MEQLSKIKKEKEVVQNIIKMGYNMMLLDNLDKTSEVFWQKYMEVLYD